MSNLNEKPVGDIPQKPLWQRTLMLLGAGTACAIFTLTFFPSAFEQVSRMIAQPISSASASEGEDFVSPARARAQKLSRAKTVVHGMYVKDAYGCSYMFQYLSAQLTLTPVLNEHSQPVCDK